MTQQSERAAASHPPAEEASAYSPSEARDALPYQPQEQAPSTHLATPRQPLGQVNSLLHNTIHLRPRLRLNSNTDLRLRPTLPHQNPRLPDAALKPYSLVNLDPPPTIPASSDSNIDAPSLSSSTLNGILCRSIKYSGISFKLADTVKPSSSNAFRYNKPDNIPSGDGL